MLPAPPNDTGATSAVLVPPLCGVPTGTPPRSSLRFTLSLPVSLGSLGTMARSDSS